MERLQKSEAREKWNKYLELSWFHSDGDTNEEDTDHGDGSVAFPVLGATIRASGHAPNFGPEISMSPFSMTVLCSSHGRLSSFPQLLNEDADHDTEDNI